MGNCVGKCCEATLECFGEFWSIHGLPFHFIAMAAFICSMGLCPWLAMLGFVPLSYLASMAIKKCIKRQVLKRSKRKRLEALFEELHRKYEYP